MSEQIIESVERALISEILNDKNSLEEAAIKLEIKDFQTEECRKIFAVILKLLNKNENIIPDNIIQFMLASPEYQFAHFDIFLHDIANQYVDSADAMSHMEIIKNISIQKQLEDFGKDLQGIKINQTSYTEQMRDLDNEFKRITNSKKTNNFVDIKDAVDECNKNIEEISKKINAYSKSGLIGLTSGFPRIDDITYGFQRGNLIILAARPGRGKTFLGLNFLLNAAKHLKEEKPVGENGLKNIVLMFSLEMGQQEISERLVSLKGSINIKNFLRGTHTNEEYRRYQKAIEELKELPIKLDFAPNLTINDIYARIRQSTVQHNISLVVVDYLQMIASSLNSRISSRYQEVSYISGKLKQMAKEFDIPIIAIAQLSRDIEKRKDADARPKLSDLRESGSIEQDADLVCFLHSKVDDEETEKEKEKREIDFIIEKHRNGSNGMVELLFSPAISRFSEKMHSSSFPKNKS